MTGSWKSLHRRILQRQLKVFIQSRKWGRGEEGRTKLSTARLSPKKDKGALIPQQRGYLNNDNIIFVNVCAYVSVLGEPQRAYP